MDSYGGKVIWAVLVSIVNTEAGPAFLLEERSKYVKQPGEVCFPGGRVEEGETPVEAALRETEEELGIPSSAISGITEIGPEFMSNGREIRPVIGYIDKESAGDLKISRGEVADTFMLPFRYVHDNPPSTYDLSKCRDSDLPDILLGYLSNYGGFRRSGETLYLEYEGHGIWGLTARIIKRVFASTAAMYFF